MGHRAPLTVSTAAPLPSSLRLAPFHPAASKSISRLSRISLLSLVQEWLKTGNQSTCGPVLGQSEFEDDSMYETAQSLDQLRQIYAGLASRNGGKREVVDRVLEGDWRNGLSLRQLAMVDIQYLLDHPRSQRWTARKFVRLTASSSKGGSPAGVHRVSAGAEELPRFHAPTFLKRLQSEVGNLVKTHYHLTRVADLPISLLRIYIHDSPYNNRHSLAPISNNGKTDNSRTILDSSKTIFIAFPDHAPYIYISSAAQQQPSRQSGPKNSSALTSTSDAATIRRLLLDALPKAFSRPHDRYGLKPTSLTARTLSALVAARGPGTTNAAQGGWSIFAEGSVDKSPLRAISTLTVEEEEEKQHIGHGDEPETRQEGSGTSKATKRKRDVSDIASDGNPNEKPVPASSAQEHKKQRLRSAQARFGNSALADDGKAIEQLDIRLEDAFSPTPLAPPSSADGIVAIDQPRPRRQRTGRDIPPAAGKQTSETHAPQAPSASSSLMSGAGTWRPNVHLKFHGAHVFAGLRRLVEAGVVDGGRMPGWMTGEEGVSVGIVREGIMRGEKGAGSSGGY